MPSSQFTAELKLPVLSPLMSEEAGVIHCRHTIEIITQVCRVFFVTVTVLGWAFRMNFSAL